MLTKGTHSGFVPPSKTNWVKLHVKYAAHALSSQNPAHEPEELSISGFAAPTSHLFESTVSGRSSLAERFPRLTIAAVAFALVAFIVIAEIQYLDGAGYSWGR
jgi:hypothetical protein